jgi:hypothetical protein
MIRRPVHLVGLLTAVAGATAVQAQSIHLAVVLPTHAPYQNGESVEGTIRCSWAPPGLAVYGLWFRLRFDGLNPSDLNLPVENPADGVDDPTRTWTSGRQPDRYVETPRASFREPPVGTSPGHMQYVISEHDGAAYLQATGDNTQENIYALQFPRDEFFPVTDPAFDLFKFSVRAPLAGAGLVTITPEVLAGDLFTNFTFYEGIPATTRAEGATFSFVPAPSAAALFGCGSLLSMCRRRRHVFTRTDPGAPLSD